MHLTGHLLPFKPWTGDFNLDRPLGEPYFTHVHRSSSQYGSDQGDMALVKSLINLDKWSIADSYV